MDLDVMWFKLSLNLVRQLFQSRLAARIRSHARDRVVTGERVSDEHDAARCFPEKHVFGYRLNDLYGTQKVEVHVVAILCVFALQEHGRF